MSSRERYRRQRHALATVGGDHHLPCWTLLMVLLMCYPCDSFVAPSRHFATIHQAASSSSSSSSRWQFQRQRHRLFSSSGFSFPNGSSFSSVGSNSSSTAAVNGASSPTTVPPAWNTNSVTFNKNGVHHSNGVAADFTLGVTIKTAIPSATSPELNHWTTLMSQGWNDTMVSSPSASPRVDQQQQQQSYTDSSSCSDRDIEQTAAGKAYQNWKSVLTYYDLQNIETYWDRILPLINYHGTAAVAKIYQALCIAYRAHRGQMRKSGEPFIIHPVEVAILLANLKMDADTVMAGLLHDTVEDTDLTFDQIEDLFGSTVRSIVEGETKVSKLPKIAFTDYADEQAENLRQMFVAMTDDYRIIIVKLADRLHNMRTLRHMKPEKQIKISRETLDIFAPLAHRMGIWQFKSELEDTAFMYLYPQEYKRLNRRLREHQKKYRETLDNSQRVLQQQLDADLTLKQQAAKVEVFGRTKEIYSLWHKMETKNELNLDNIVDVVALRVIITPPPDPNEDAQQTDRGVWLCYHILGLVQHLPGFQPVPTRVKDYISFPKPNGYQSLHTALILNGQTIEVQIRTSMMHQVAEFGMASHWAYTDMKRRRDSDNGIEFYNTPWLSSIKEWQNDMISSRDFVDSVRRELLGKRVFVFLRNGKILNLARGATAIDAAFQIHTEVGLNMHGVEINGKAVSFSYELQNGDVVSILTGEGKPSTEWMRYAKSRSTRSKLRGYFRARQKDNLREAGEIILIDYLIMHRFLIERSTDDLPLKVPSTAPDFVEFLRQRSQYGDTEALYTAIGKHHDRSILHKVVSEIFNVPKRILIAAEENMQLPTPSTVLATVRERRRQSQSQEESSNISPPPRAHSEGASASTKAPDSGVHSDLDCSSVWNDSKSDYADPEHLCNECLPVYGDAIIGTQSPGTDVVTTVHRVGCPHAQRAIIHAAAERNQKAITAAISQNGSSTLAGEMNMPRIRVDSVSLRQGSDPRRTWNIPGGRGGSSRFSTSSLDLPISLQWSEDDKTALYMAEVVVHARDRKLLLADCSEVVSETSAIVKTGSLTRDDHATLVFLVKISCLDQLQVLMDRLGLIRSVMSVERRFGSELL